MRGRMTAVLTAVLLVLAFPVAASAHRFSASHAFSAMLMSPMDFNEVTGAGYVATKNMHPLGFSQRLPGAGFSRINSDLAFWGSYAFQGSYSGFRILDISQPDNPTVVTEFGNCTNGLGQGDLVVWDNVMSRSVDAAAPAGGATCGPDPAGNLAQGEEGLHIFDISTLGNPVVKKFVDLPCGSHTASGVPDVANNRLLIYSTPSSGACDWVDIVEVPLDDPAAAKKIGQANSIDGIACHDTGVILGDAMLASCAGGVGYAVWSLGGARGGSLTSPKLLYTKNMQTEEGVNVNTGHSAAFTWDGQTLIFGHEPNGGTQPRCQKTGTPLPSGTYPVQTDDMKSFFFFDALSGERLGKWTLPRDQTAAENCTLHNYNIVPTTNGRDILVHGSYQSGIGVLDFTDPANAKELAYADPQNAVPLGGDWSSHWYDGRIYESDIARGFMVWDVSGDATAGALKLGHLNPQTQEFTID